MKTEPAALGVAELLGIGKGVQACDLMLKKADVSLVLARVVCPGKYLVGVKGSVEDVNDAVRAGLAAAGDSVFDSLILPSPHPQIFTAIHQVTEVDKVAALGLIETYSMCSALEAADAAAKRAEVALLEIRLAIMLAGKAYVSLTGSESAVKEALEAAAEPARAKGLLVSAVLIPRPEAELLRAIL